MMRGFLITFCFLSTLSFSQIKPAEELKQAAEITYERFQNFEYSDTFYIQYFYQDTADLYFLIDVNSVSGENERLVYYRKDSSAFNGTIIWQSFDRGTYSENEFSLSYERRVNRYENSHFIGGIRYEYVKRSNRPSFESPEQFDKLFDCESEGYRLIRVSSNGYETDYFEDGTPSSIEYRTKMDADLNSNYERVDYFQSGTPRQYHLVESISGVKREEHLRLNEQSDTTTLGQWTNSHRDGLFLENLNDDTWKMQLRTVWEDNLLKDILNPGILFINDEKEVISASEFYALIKHDRSSFHWVYRAIPDSIIKEYNLSYSVIFSTNPAEYHQLFWPQKGKKSTDDLIRKFLKKNRKALGI